jgi:hypothetical protein
MVLEINKIIKAQKNGINDNLEIKMKNGQEIVLRVA